jgi:4-amino-4-deoxy-L-arabinose transferase-like glycosyltransferase
MGLGFLIKGLAAFLIPIGVIFAYLFISGQRWKIKKLGLRQGSAIVCFFVLLWLVPLVYHLGLVSTLRELLLKQTMDRVLDARVHKRAFYYYLVNFIPNLFPYSIFFFLSLIYTVFRIRQQDKFRMFVFCWFSFPFLAFSLISSKLDIYLIPSYAAIAILVEQFLLDGVEKKGKKSSMIVTSITFFLIPIAVFVKKKLILEIDPSLFCLFLIYGSFSILTGILGIRWATRKKYERFIYTIAGNITVLLVILTFSSPILNEYIGYQKFSEIIKSEKEKNQQLKILGFQESNVNRLRCLVGDYSIQNIRDSDLIETMTYQEDLLILLKNTKLPQLKKDYQLVYKNQKFSIIKYTHSENFTTE